MSLHALLATVLAPEPETRQRSDGDPRLSQTTLPDSLPDGYRLIARQIGGDDVILCCGGRQEGRWLDRFTPVSAEDADNTVYSVSVDGARYRLVRSLKSVPRGFRYISSDATREREQPPPPARPCLHASPR